MTSNVLVETEADSRPDLGARKLGGEADRGAIENWIDGRLDAIAVAVVAAGLVARLVVAQRSYLNPDEALHYLVIHQPSAFLAYQASTLEAHPPLTYLLLYFWQFLGRSELMLRLPFVLAGAGFSWLSFKWMQLFFSKTVALIGLILITFSPAMINLSCEIRQYSVLLCCLAASLYFLGWALRDNSPRQMWYFSAFLCLAILSHYSAALFVLAIGIYTLVRIADGQISRKVIAAWAAGQAGALALYAFLYFTQLSKLKSSIATWDSPFEQYYFHWRDGDLYFFLSHNTSNIFLYLFKQRYVSAAILLIFACGVVLLFAKGLFPGPGKPRSCQLAILVSLPFVISWGAAIGGVYPYVGSRHTIFLALFAIAAASFFLATLVRQKLWAGILAAVVLVGISNASEDPSRARITKENQRRELMASALNYIHASIPRGESILLDKQSSFMMAYYLCGPQETPSFDATQGEFFRFSCGGYSFVGFSLWKLKADTFVSEFDRVAHTYGWKPGTRVWVVQAGWGVNLDVGLPSQSRQFRCLTPRIFGQNISVIPFVTAPDLSPNASSPNC